MTSGVTPASEATASHQRDDMAWLLRQFVADVPGVLHAVLLSRDGLRLLDSEVDKDWADELSAALSGWPPSRRTPPAPATRSGRPGRSSSSATTACSSSRAPVAARPSKAIPATTAAWWTPSSPSSPPRTPTPAPSDSKRDASSRSSPLHADPRTSRHG
ncbi:roadblock/LC7 domain-containing protein [Streptomyces sp. M10(2022)]